MSCDRQCNKFGRMSPGTTLRPRGRGTYEERRRAQNLGRSLGNSMCALLHTKLQNVVSKCSMLRNRCFVLSKYPMNQLARFLSISLDFKQLLTNLVPDNFRRNITVATFADSSDAKDSPKSSGGRLKKSTHTMKRPNDYISGAISETSV